MSQINSTPLPTLDYTGRDFYTIQRELLAYIRATRPDELNSFFEGDNAKILVELLSYTGHGLHDAIDRISEEAFLATARLRESALRHAATYNYHVATATAASTILVPETYKSIPKELTQDVSAKEVQTITFAATPTAGTFALQFQSESTVLIQYNATAQEIKTALEALTTIGVGNVDVSKPSATQIVVTFKGTLAWIDQPLLAVVTNTMTRNEKQTVTITGSPVAGTFTLTYSGQTTSDIPFDANAAAVQLALVNLSNIGPDDVEVTGGPGPNGAFVVEFKSALASQDVAMMIGVGTGGPVLTITETIKGAAITTTVVETTKGKDETYNITFAKGQQLTVGTRTWEVSETTTINGLDVNSTTYQDVFRIPVSEGRSFTEQFTGAGEKFASFTTENGDVIEDTFEIRVGDPDGDVWVRVETLALAEEDQHAYAIRFDANGRAIVFFGDGIQGSLIRDGVIVYMSGKSGGGKDGNVGINAIRASLTGTAADGPLGTILLSVAFTNVVAASGGADPATLEEIRRAIPAWIRTVDKALTAEDYTTLGMLFKSSNGSIGRVAPYLASAAIAFQTAGNPISPSEPMIVPEGTQIVLGGRTFQFSREFRVEETDPIIFFNPNVVNIYVWSPADKGFIGSSDSLMADLRSYLQERSVVTTTIVCLSGRSKIVNINLGTVIYSGAFKKTVVEQAIIDATKAFFLSDAVIPGQPLRLSDYYNIIENVPGVDHFVIQSPTDDVPIAKDEMPYLGTLSYDLQVSQLPIDDENQAAFDGELFN